jgi:hypothetical protein
LNGSVIASVSNEWRFCACVCRGKVAALAARHSTGKDQLHKLRRSEESVRKSHDQKRRAAQQYARRSFERPGPHQGGPFIFDSAAGVQASWTQQAHRGDTAAAAPVLRAVTDVQRIAKPRQFPITKKPKEAAFSNSPDAARLGVPLSELNVCFALS